MNQENTTNSDSNLIPLGSSEPYLTAADLGVSSDYGSYLHRLGMFIVAFRFQSFNDDYQSVYHKNDIKAP